MNNNVKIDSANRIVAGELKSNAMLTQDIARSILSQLPTAPLTPAARKTKDGWMAILEDMGGKILLCAMNYKSEALALAAAKTSYAYLK